MNEAGFDVISLEMDFSGRASIKALITEWQKYGKIKMLVNAAGVSPSQAVIESILKIDLYGTVVLAGECGKCRRARRCRRHHFECHRFPIPCGIL